MTTFENWQTREFTRFNEDYLVEQMNDRRDHGEDLTWFTIRAFLVDYLEQEKDTTLGHLASEDIDTFALILIKEGYETIRIDEITNHIADQLDIR